MNQITFALIALVAAAGGLSVALTIWTSYQEWDHARRATDELERLERALEVWRRHGGKLNDERVEELRAILGIPPVDADTLTEKTSGEDFRELILGRLEPYPLEVLTLDDERHRRTLVVLGELPRARAS